MSYYGFLASEGISTITSMQGFLTIAQIIQKRVAWSISVPHAHRWESTMDQGQNGNPRIGAPKCCHITDHIIDILKNFVLPSNSCQNWYIYGWSTQNTKLPYMMESYSMSHMADIFILLRHQKDRAWVVAAVNTTFYWWCTWRNLDVIIITHRIMVIPFRNIWIAQERVVVHVQDMVLSSRTVLSIFEKGNSDWKW